MSRKKTTIQDLIFFIRNGIIDCKDYFVPLNAISYVRLKTQRTTSVLSLEINTGHTFLLRHSDLAFLSDLMEIIKSNQFESSASYEIDMVKGSILCIDEEAPDLSSETIAPVTEPSTKTEPITKTEPVTPPETHTSVQPTAAAAFRSHVKRPSTVSSKAIHMAEERNAPPPKPAVLPTLPKAGSGVGLTNGVSIGCGFTAAELYGHKKKEVSNDTTTAQPQKEELPLHSATLLPELQLQTPEKKKPTSQKTSAPPKAPSVQPPKHKKTLPKYYSASEYLRNHGQLSTTSDGPIAPYEEILENQLQNEKELNELIPSRTFRVTSGLSLTASSKEFTHKDWTDIEYYFFQRKASFPRDDVRHKICEKLEDLAYHKDEAGMMQYLNSLSTDTLQNLFSDAAYRKLPLLKSFLQIRLQKKTLS
ncbi:MAG: hypothetical protein ACI4HI_09180 [Lachnospiraceae bacterium]